MEGRRRKPRPRRPPPRPSPPRNLQPRSPSPRNHRRPGSSAPRLARASVKRETSGPSGPPAPAGAVHAHIRRAWRESGLSARSSEDGSARILDNSSGRCGSPGWPSCQSGRSDWLLEIRSSAATACSLLSAVQSLQRSVRQEASRWISINPTPRPFRQLRSMKKRISSSSAFATPGSEWRRAMISFLFLRLPQATSPITNGWVQHSPASSRAARRPIGLRK